MSETQFKRFMMMLEAIRLAVLGTAQATLIANNYQGPLEDAAGESSRLAHEVLGSIDALDALRKPEVRP